MEKSTGRTGREEEYSGLRKSGLFTALVSYHIEHNLIGCGGYFERGRLNDPLGGEVREGVYEGPYEGVLVMADGDHTIKELVQAGVLADFEIGQQTPTRTQGDLVAYLKENHYGDGAFMYTQGGVRRVALMNNHASLLSRMGEEGVYRLVPGNFVSEDGSVPVKGNLNHTKTLAALLGPQAITYLDGFQVRRSAYGNTGMGAVVHTNHDGVYEMFHFRYDKNARNPLLPVAEGGGIIGVYRRFKRNKDNELAPYMERIIDKGNIKIPVPRSKSKSRPLRNHRRAIAAD